MRELKEIEEQRALVKRKINALTQDNQLYFLVNEYGNLCFEEALCKANEIIERMRKQNE